jgi:hypothetical protein
MAKGRRKLSLHGDFEIRLQETESGEPTGQSPWRQGEETWVGREGTTQEDTHAAPAWAHLCSGTRLQVLRTPFQSPALSSVRAPEGTKHTRKTGSADAWRDKA